MIKMNIPNKLKIGGFEYDVEFTENFKLGQLNVSAEIDYKELKIRICEAAQKKQEHDFLHEMFHAIYDFIGITEHDEQHIDALASALHAIITDNPKMFENS